MNETVEEAREILASSRLLAIEVCPYMHMTSVHVWYTCESTLTSVWRIAGCYLIIARCSVGVRNVLVPIGSQHQTDVGPCGTVSDQERLILPKRQRRFRRLSAAGQKPINQHIPLS